MRTLGKESSSKRNESRNRRLQDLTNCIVSKLVAGAWDGLLRVSDV